jgi:hypothetical protein
MDNALTGVDLARPSAPFGRGASCRFAAQRGLAKKKGAKPVLKNRGLLPRAPNKKEIRLFTLAPFRLSIIVFKNKEILFSFFP